MTKAALLVLALLCLARNLHLGHSAQSRPDDHLLQMFGHDSALSQTKDVHDETIYDRYGNSGIDLLNKKFTNMA